MTMRLALICDLITRARYDIERGWTAAALDALGLAERLLQEAPTL